jgi:hypothetical protein
MAEMTAFRKIIANRTGDTTNLLMRGRYNQNTPRRISGHISVEISNRAATLAKGNLAYRAKPLQLLKALFGNLAQGLNGVSILRVSLTLYAGRQGDALHLGFALQNAQRVGRLDTLNLACVTREDDACHMLFGKPKYVLHLTARDHSGLVDDQDPTPESRLRRSILKKA